ncbi:hypothetical protein [Kurthia sp. Dielmo]|uniref:hypothetical protein n=1 Tax=Kurthia sp. Dielmo TaxID=1033738 RepID=UPI001644A4C2|nr:hypothetical protein [Kurthia sp. Dielmo]
MLVNVEFLDNTPVSKGNHQQEVEIPEDLLKVTDVNVLNETFSKLLGKQVIVLNITPQ